MAAAKKFLFETSFDQARPVASGGVSFVPKEKPAPTFSEKDLEEATQTAFAEGEAAGYARAAQSREALVADTMARMEAGLAQIRETLAAEVAGLKGKAVEAALTVVRKLVPGLIRQSGMAEIEALIDTSLKSLLDEPRVVVRVCDSLLDPLKQQIAPLTERTGYAGRVVLIADDSLGESGCRVEWADGGVERDTSFVWAEVDKAVARFTAALAATGAGATAPHSERHPSAAPVLPDGSAGAAAGSTTDVTR